MLFKLDKLVISGQKEEVLQQTGGKNSFLFIYFIY